MDLTTLMIVYNIGLLIVFGIITQKAKGDFLMITATILLYMAIGTTILVSIVGG